MTFFDKKEEVLDIELTQYGKHLLSTGKFKPAYYQFFDDDVIYDYKYTGGEEELQREIQERIKETPRPHTQYNFVSSQDDIKKQLIQNSSNKKGASLDSYIPFSMKHRVMSMPLGRSEFGQQKNPSWKIRTFRNPFLQTNTFITGNYSNIKTTRLDLGEIPYNLSVGQDSRTSVQSSRNTTFSGPSMVPNINNLSKRFKDKTYVQIESNYVLLDLQELNTDFENENFEIELYSVETDENGIEEIRQLQFTKRNESVINNLLTDESGVKPVDSKNPNMAENYFNIRMDKEIESSVMCKNLSLEEKQILVATKQLDLECEELYGTLNDPRIKSDVKIEDLGDNC